MSESVKPTVLQNSDLVKCRYCNFLAFKESDLEAHLKAFGPNHGDQLRKYHESIDYGNEDAEFRSGLWRKGTFGDDEFCAADAVPDITRQCRIKGRVRNGLYEFSLSQNGKWLKRKHI